MTTLFQLTRYSIYQKLSVSLLLTFLVIVTAFVVISQQIESVSKDRAEQKLHQQLASHLVHDNPLLASGKFDQKALENLFHSMMILGNSFEFYVLDNQGGILSYSAKPGAVIRDKIELQPVFDFLTVSPSFPIYAQDPRSHEDKIFSAAPIMNSGHQVGYLFVIVRSQVYDSIFKQTAANDNMRIYGLVAVASLAFLFSILLISFRFIIAPLKQMTNDVENIQRDGNSGSVKKLDINAKGKEVDCLVMAFNQLIEQTNQQFSKLKQVDAERRELLTHLSHDLRTPLASLQGFIETITINQDKLSPSKRLEYLNRSLQNAKQLKRFVDQIFELAHLESNQVDTHLESLPIAELLYDLKEKFLIKSQGKGVQLVVDVKDDDLHVMTDIAKLERILSNLVENAIRHTPEGGCITFKVIANEPGDQILVEVRDTGTGIPKEDLAYLFDPRYRGSQSLEDGERHIGLGLTITAKLLKILGSEIRAANNRDSGAKFTFCLPRDFSIGH